MAIQLFRRLPNLPSFRTCCVCLELRSLPSASFTRLPRYYESLRYPQAPRLFLAGVRLVIADHTKGLPVLRALPLYACCRHYPGAATGLLFAHFPSRISLPRKGRRVGLRDVLIRGLLGVHSRYGLHTRWIVYSDSLHRRLQPLRYLHSCSDCFPPERSPRYYLKEIT